MYDTCKCEMQKVFGSYIYITVLSNPTLLILLQILEKEHLMQKPLQGKSESSITYATIDSSDSSSSPLEHCTSSLECTTEEDDEEDDVELGQQHRNDVLTNAHNDNNDDDLPSSCGENDVENHNRGNNNISVIVQLDKTEDEETTPASSSSSVATPESAEMEYTHVRIPCPGMMQCPNSGDSSSDSSSSDADASRSSTPSPLALKDNTLMSTTNTTTPRTREVSKNCPICLSTYEPHDRICYSSNSECSHVFHCDCIIRWFVEMGRQNTDIVIGHGTKLDESLLLDYMLSCPCCRQPFVAQNDDDEFSNKKNKKGSVDDMEEKKNGVASEKKMKNEKMTSKVTIPRSTSFTSFSSCKIMPVMETEEDDQECPV